MTDCAAIVISYNTREITLACLRSVSDRGLGGMVSHGGSIASKKLYALHLVVLDNASTDGSADAIAAEFPEVHLIRSGVNLGFAAANNLASKAVSGEYLLLLNPDTVVLEGAIDRLLDSAAACPNAGIWGGRTLFEDRSLNPASCWARPTPWSLLCMAAGLSSLFPNSALFNPEGYGGWQRDSVREVDIVSGCFLLIRRELWERLCGFDTAFFMYGEDADLCLRARELGARPMISPAATIVHYGGASERVRADKMVRLLDAKVRLIRRHWRPQWVRFGIAMLKIWPLTRALVWKALSPVLGAAARDKANSWWSVWRRRGQWAA